MTPLVFHPIYSQLSLPVRHRFPIEKYQAIFDRLVTLGADKNQFYTPKCLEHNKLTKIFDPSYISSLVNGTLSEKAMKRIGFPWSKQLVERTLTAAAGTVLCSELAIKHGRAVNLTGGYHHAFANYGSGFCMINDLYLAALNALQYENINNVLIFDCDVHQGDGTAKLASNHKHVFTVSIHGEKNFPFRKQKSNLDFELPRHTQDEIYLNTVQRALSLSLEMSNADMIVYDAGVDVHENDDLGHLAITTQGILKRDKLVFDTAEKLNVPIAAVIGGGYQRDIKALVDAHLQLFIAAGAVKR